MKMKNNIFAIPAAAAEIPPKPNKAATSEMIKNISAQRNIEIPPLINLRSLSIRTNSLKVLGPSPGCRNLVSFPLRFRATFRFFVRRNNAGVNLRTKELCMKRTNKKPKKMKMNQRQSIKETVYPEQSSQPDLEEDKRGPLEEENDDDTINEAAR
jgi:hypothetical protein